MENNEQVLDIVWAVVLVQGAITLLSFLEALVVGDTQGAALLPILVLTSGGAVLALASARGLRRRRPWARRVTIVAEWLVLLWGVINLVATAVLVQQVALMPLLTTVVAPIVVLRMLRRARPSFVTPSAEVVG